jgi:hypothetical protein
MLANIEKYFSYYEMPVILFEFQHITMYKTNKFDNDLTFYLFSYIIDISK